jgi:hypothetical protein
MKIMAILAILGLTACGIADPEVIPYDAPEESSDATAGLNPSNSAGTEDKQIFDGKIMPVIKARCTSCHNTQHSIPFVTMVPAKIHVKLAEVVGCGNGAFNQFLSQGHPGGDVSGHFDPSTRQNFRSTCY